MSNSDLYTSAPGAAAAIQAQAGTVYDVVSASITLSTHTVVAINAALEHLGDKIDALQAALRLGKIVS